MNRNSVGSFWIQPNDCPSNNSINTNINNPLNTNLNNPGSTTTSAVEQQYWDAVKSSQKSSDFQSYLNTYPNGQYVPIARLRISQLGGSVNNSPLSQNPINTTTSANSVEQQYWDSIRNSQQSQDFQNYLRDYPNGQFAPIARLKVSQLGGSNLNNTSNLNSPEEQYWNTVNHSRDSRDFQGYLNNYPNGKYASLARLKMSQLGGSSTISTNTNSAVEDQFWNNVKFSTNANDFQRYLNNYPGGKYSSNRPAQDQSTYFK